MPTITHLHSMDGSGYKRKAMTNRSKAMDDETALKIRKQLSQEYQEACVGEDAQEDFEREYARRIRAACRASPPAPADVVMVPRELIVRAANGLRIGIDKEMCEQYEWAQRDLQTASELEAMLEAAEKGAPHDAIPTQIKEFPGKAVELYRMTHNGRLPPEETS